MIPSSSGSSDGSSWMLRYTFGAAAGFFAMSWIGRQRLIARTDRAIWKKPTTNLTTDPAATKGRENLAHQIASIVSTCPSLQNPRYDPPWWIVNGWINVGFFIFKESLFTKKKVALKREVLLPVSPDLSIDYLDDEVTQQLPIDAPLLLVLPTIGGSGPTHSYYMAAAAKRGWRACTLNRRGLAYPIEDPSSNVNLLGSQDDTAEQVASVCAKYPKARFVGLAGLSGGSGLAVNYLGKYGGKEGSPVQAACSLCPAYCIETAFIEFGKRHPLVDSHLRKDLIEKLVSRNRQVFLRRSVVSSGKEDEDEEAGASLKGSKIEAACDACESAKTLDELIRAHWPLTGAKSLEDYYALSNPMANFKGISCPFLVLNANDDMVCLPENVREDLPKEHGGVILVRTAFGSHISYNEGLFGQGSYLIRLSLDFLEAAMAAKCGPVDVEEN